MTSPDVNHAPGSWGCQLVVFAGEVAVLVAVGVLVVFLRRGLCLEKPFDLRTALHREDHLQLVEELAPFAGMLN